MWCLFIIVAIAFVLTLYCTFFVSREETPDEHEDVDKR